MTPNSDPGRPVDILLVEDNESDVRLLREAWRDTRMKSTIHVVPDGVEAMAFLRRQGAYAGAPAPDLVLLDLNLPRKDGREVLAEIKSDPALRRIPVVVLTTSRDAGDIAITYDNHANCYIVKPLHFQEFSDVVRAIEDFWLTVVALPRSE